MDGDVSHPGDRGTHGILGGEGEPVSDSKDGLLWRVLSCNVGMEIGQLIAVATMTLVALGLQRLLSGPMAEVRRAEALMTASVIVLVGGVAAVALSTYETFKPEPTVVVVSEAVPVAEPAQGDEVSCSVSANAEEFPFMGGHVATNFFEPDQAPPLGDFGHSLGDGHVVILYPPTLPTENVDELRELVTGPEGAGLLAGPDVEGSGDGSLRAINAYDVMTCDGVATDQISEFTSAWFEQIG